MTTKTETIRGTLFEKKTFVMHSGGLSHYKIECDSLTPEDYQTLAFIICDKLERMTKVDYTGSGIKEVIGVPRGGIPFAKAIEEEVRSRGGYDGSGITLIVDDVLTTGASMEAARASCGDSDACGVVVFARNKYPDWVKPIFEMHWWNTEDQW